MATNNGKTTPTTITAEPGPSKSDKWNKATGMATKEDGTTDTVVLSANQMLMLSNPSKDDITSMTNDPQWEFAPEILRLKEGQMLQGYLEGNGPPVEFTKTEGGVVKTNTVKTWIIAAPNGTARVSILSSAQLDKALPPLVGGTVKILREGEQNIGEGKRVTLYKVGGERQANGQRRTWALPVVIDAHAIEAAKPAGALASGPEHADGEDATA